MKLDSLLKYQSIDVELKKLKKEMTSNENCKIAEDTRRQFGAMKQTVEKSEAVATKVYGGYEESVKHYEETLKKADELISKLNSEELTEEESDKIFKGLEAINAKLAEISEFIVNIKKKGEDAVRDFSTAQKHGMEIKDKYTSAKNEIKKLEEQYAPKIKDLQDKLAAARAEVAPELMSKYEKITAEGRNPAFVPVYAGDGSMNCSACGYGLSLNTQSELKEQGYCVCEKCHRVIYSDKK